MNERKKAMVARTFFVPEELWERARKKAEQEGIYNMSFVLRRLLQLYVEEKVKLF